MPPKRRTAATRQQATLSFHGKQQNKVTKSQSPRTAAKQAKKDPSAVEEFLISDGDGEPTTAQKAIEEQVHTEVESLETVDPLINGASKTEDVLGGRAQTSEVGARGGKGSGWVGDEESEARKVTDTQIKKYWRAKESERKAPRVHQQELSLHEKILREWDMSAHYGPCIGIARLKRWKRANMLGLKPPIEVLAVLLREMDGGVTNSQRAHVDELMSSRFIADS